MVQNVLSPPHSRRKRPAARCRVPAARRPAAARGAVLFQCVGQLPDQAQRRPASGQKRGQLADRPDHEIHQVDEQNDHACREAAARQRQPRTGEKYAQLRNEYGHGADHADQHLEPPAAEFFLLQRAVALGKQLEDLPFGLERLDDREAAETVRQRGGEVPVSPETCFSAACSLPAGQERRCQRQRRHTNRDGGQQRRIPEHHEQRAEKRHRLGDHSELLREIVRLHAGRVVGQRGEIRRRALVAEGGDALFRELLKGKLLYWRMARAIKRGSEAYFSRNSTAHSTTKPPVISASAASGSAPGAPEAASISCCMSHVTIRFQRPSCQRGKHGQRENAAISPVELRPQLLFQRLMHGSAAFHSVSSSGLSICSTARWMLCIPLVPRSS